MPDNCHRLTVLYRVLRYADVVILIWILVCAAAGFACDFGGIYSDYAEYIHTELSLTGAIKQKGTTMTDIKELYNAPWTYEEHSDYGYVLDSNGNVLVDSSQETLSGIAVTKEQLQLIAAAPEILAHLANFVSVHNLVTAEGGRGRMIPQHILDLITKETRPANAP